MENIFQRVTFDYVVVTETSKEGKQYLAVYKIGNPKVRIGFAKPLFKKDSNGRKTREISGFKLTINEWTDGIIQEGKKFVTRKGFVFTAKKTLSKNHAKYYWALIDEAGKIKGFADQNRSQIKLTFWIIV